MTALQQRLIVGGVATLLACLIVYLALFPLFKPLFTAIIAGSISIAMWELFKIAHAKGYTPAKNLSVVLGCLYAAAVSLSTQYKEAALLPEITLYLILLLCFAYYLFKGKSPFINLSITIFSLAYLAVPLSCLLSVVYFSTGRQMEDKTDAAGSSTSCW